MASVVHVGSTLAKASKLLEIPFICTEQYPKAFGATVPELGLTGSPSPLQKVFSKTQFSMVTSEVEAELVNVRSVVLFGIEAHVCVLQTALDLLSRNIDVHLVADGVSSQRPFDRAAAFDRLKQEGAYISTMEMVLFQLLQDAKNPLLKEISALCNEQKNPRPPQGDYPL